ncbi:MAG TPA: bifunctional homocysteine S-methyltransferase/methylenetetrahydrofolate reductase [Streptosporangiaceae bacterium]|jgi:methionine synthase I (cobalamin-dependent)/5,10-methylenetetrahydrofolate reductase|nr:bifunctional homocysteine S-methyltransferase/methylenetetrahydrofolate reductase [Streptosporangiaceae bacterium]
MNVRAMLAEHRILVCDGAMGTMLHAAGNSLDQALPALNLSNPALVQAIHESYIAAGVDIIQTNTFAASRIRLAEHDLGDRTAEINQAGVRIARQAIPAGSGVLVAGSVSPTVTVQQRRRVHPRERASALREQIEALAGVDIIILETFGYLDELAEAIEIAGEVTDIPVIAQATFGVDGRTLSGHTPREIAAEASGTQVVALGTNCTLGPQRSLAVVRELREHTGLALSVQPNSGLPRRVAPARFEYEVDAEYFASYIRQALDAGAVIVGGCCGTTPTHLAAVVEVVNSRRHQLTASAVVRVSGRDLRAPESGSTHAPAGLAEPDHQVFAAELTAPPTGDVGELLTLATDLAGLGIDFLSISAARTSRAQVSTINLAVHLRHIAGIDTVASVTTWDRTIMALQADLLGAHALGLRRIVCETGTPPLVGDYPHVDGIWDVDSVGLIELLDSLNHGIDFYQLQLGSKTDFSVGGRINPGSSDPDREADRALTKISAGARFLITRPVYELTGLKRLLDAIGGRVPVLAAIRPLTSFEEAEYLQHEVPDVTIPADILARLERAGGGAKQAGVQLAADLAAEVSEMSSGILIAPAVDVLSTTTAILSRCR